MKSEHSFNNKLGIPAPTLLNSLPEAIAAVIMLF
jgi:hypothetical protein